ncbi:hypothetical protein A7A08_00594 [Methyloligella halotolerans]|uniref:DUF2497 domain-containing protein n=1 Tax=Methyloligella halotolerans TaxID=1177755 RepID=A0A1E2S2X9_9HYPH|nr:DUF2497 domain-containing protein [Methyloligella halotolerans]ODA68762.1 hypothetical protein A7A08_00594 [Methyloligella halotolerans]
MSSTDRAPEPTMEEILASIRRIISEEENNDAPDEAAAEADEVYTRPAQQQPEPTAPPAGPGAPSAAPHGAQTDPQPDAPDNAPATGADESAPADIEFVEETIEELTIAVEPEDEVAGGGDEILELGDLTAGAPEDSAPATADEPLELSDDGAFPFEEEDEPEDTGEALVRETSALEAAIAALKGDQSRSGMMETPSEPEEEQFTQAAEAKPAGETPFPAEASEEPSLESALREVAEEDDDVDFEVGETYGDPDDDETLAEDAAAFPGAYASERRNGAAHHRESADFAHAAAAGPLEETVKAMLRPMLREWLDENMDRLLQEALHEELQSDVKPQRN